MIDGTNFYIILKSEFLIIILFIQTCEYFIKFNIPRNGGIENKAFIILQGRTEVFCA
jgi:hypothetical protein